MAQLILINLPGYFPANSPYVWNPFHVPKAGTPVPNPAAANPLAYAVNVCLLHYETLYVRYVHNSRRDSQLARTLYFPLFHIKIASLSRPYALLRHHPSGMHHTNAQQVENFAGVTEVFTNPAVFDVIYAPKMKAVTNNYGNILCFKADDPLYTRDVNNLRKAVSTDDFPVCSINMRPNGPLRRFSLSHTELIWPLPSKCRSSRPKMGPLAQLCNTSHVIFLPS